MTADDLLQIIALIEEPETPPTERQAAIKKARHWLRQVQAQEQARDAAFKAIISRIKFEDVIFVELGK